MGTVTMGTVTMPQWSGSANEKEGNQPSGRIVCIHQARKQCVPTWHFLLMLPCMSRQLYVMLREIAQIYIAEALCIFIVSVSNQLSKTRRCNMLLKSPRAQESIVQV